MLATAAAATQAYRRLAIESQTLGSDSHQLVSLLFSNALSAIEQSRAATARRDMVAKAAASERALRLVDEGLKAAVNRSVVPLGESLYQIYDYCARRLLYAHLKQDDAVYAEVATLLTGLADAWQAITPKNESAGR